MSRNLANIYALLKESYGETYIISYCQLPTYLQNIVGSEAIGKHIFVRLENRNAAKNANIVSPTILSLNKTPTTDLNLTGSPLKDDGIDEISKLSSDLKIDATTIWKPEEEYQRGLAVAKARQIICHEKFQKQKNADGSVWILCDAGDGDKTLFLQYEFSAEATFQCGIIRFAGIVPASSINSSYLLERHSSAGQFVETFIENIYKMKSDILVRCAWSTTATKPALIELKSGDVTLSHKFYLDDCNVFTQGFLNQLQMLICIRKDIIAYKEAEKNSAEPVYRCGCGIEVDELRESINTMMTELGGLPKTENGLEIECGIEAVVQKAGVRRLNDLTDNLWMLLTRCSSYKNLKAAFNLLFQCAARCSIVNVPTNNNRLAEIITEVSNHRLAIPCLTGAEPLELLLEIGLEKLFKDYEYMFTESKICSPNCLRKTNEANDSENVNRQSNYRKSLRNAMKSDTNTPRKTLLHNRAGALDARKQITEDINCFRNSNFDEYESSMKLAKLLQIHCTLEHLLTLQINLNLQSAFSDICEQLLNRSLKPCEYLEDSFVDEMVISIPVHNNLREYLDGKDPYSRRITFKSKNKFRQQQTTFFFCMENVCPPSVSEGFDSEELKTGKENVYYSWMYQKIQTLRN